LGTDSSSIIFPLKRIGLILGEELLVLSAFCGVGHICGEREREQESKRARTHESERARERESERDSVREQV